MGLPSLPTSSSALRRTTSAMRAMVVGVTVSCPFWKGAVISSYFQLTSPSCQGARKRGFSVTLSS